MRAKVGMGNKIYTNDNLDSLLTEHGMATLKDRYICQGESYQDVFARVARTYGSDFEHSQRLYFYMSNLWFMPATPILSNAGTNKGLPISCFVNEVNDDLRHIVDTWSENVWLASNGGGIGTYWGNLRSIGESVGTRGETSGIIPFIHVQDALTLAISQGSLRRGAAAVYLPIEHPEIEEFISIRKTTGGDINRKSHNLHHGVVISDHFMECVLKRGKFDLLSPKTNKVIRTISAFDLWANLLDTRLKTGEPYILFIDAIKRGRSKVFKKLGLSIKTSNLCSEILLPTGIDVYGKERTAVCCLSSVNANCFNEWKSNTSFIYDIMVFLDNVLEDFIQRAPHSMRKAVYSASMERSIGLGVMGLHSHFQGEGFSFESELARKRHLKIIKHIWRWSTGGNYCLAAARGACPDARNADPHRKKPSLCVRFSNVMAIAPTANISIICGGVSPSIEPYVSNAFVHKTLSGSFAIKNKSLQKLLELKGRNDLGTWESIMENNGSVQHLRFLNEEEKSIYKTAFEIPYESLIAMAGDRNEFVCQSTSLNLFLKSSIKKQNLHNAHALAWKSGVKSLYYLRSTSSDSAKVLSKGDIECENCE